MKNVLVSLVLLATLCAAATAQTNNFLADPAATLIGTFPVRVGLTSGTNGEPILAKQTASSGDVITLVGSFRTSTGVVSYQIVSDSIRYTGDPRLIDDIATPQIYSWLAQAAVAEGTRLGFTIAPDCSAPAVVKAYAHPCVVRSGSGTTTHFTACDNGIYSMWQYDVCKPQTVQEPTITLTQVAHLGLCVAPCQTTSPAGNGGAQNTMQ